MILKKVSYYKRLFIILTGIMLIGLASGCSASDADEKRQSETAEYELTEDSVNMAFENGF